MALTVKTCVVSVPSLFTPSKASSYTTPHLSIPYKPFTVKLSCSTSLSLFSVKNKEPLLRICTVSAQQEDNPVLVEELNESEEKVFQGKFNWGGENESGGDGYAEPPEEAKVYVGNLPYDVDSEQLAKLFEEAGVVEISEVIYNRETDQSRGFGFVTMSTMEEAEKAVEMFNRYEVNGRLLTVNKAAPKGSRAERPPRVFDSTPSPRIYVGNLPWTADDARLEEVFSEYGKVVSARVVSDRETGRSRGFGFVVMSSESEVNDAISNLDGQSLDGRVIRVNVAEEKPRRSRF